MCPGQADGSWHAALDQVFGSGAATTIDLAVAGADCRLHMLPRLDELGATVGVATWVLDRGDAPGLERQNNFLLGELKAQGEAYNRLNRDMEIEAQQRSRHIADARLTRRLHGAEARCVDLEAEVEMLKRELAAARAL